MISLNIMKKKAKGFTLVELLAVIVILAIILVIAVPKVMNVIDDAKKATLESTAKMIAGQAEKQKVQNTILGNNEKITCDSIAKINNLDYASCDITFVDNTAQVTIKGAGKFEGLNLCNGTKTNAIATKEECIKYNSGCDTLYWDGNTDGLKFIETFYKVSDVILNADDLSNGIIVIDNEDYEYNLQTSSEDIIIEETGLILTDYFISIPYDKFYYEGTYIDSGLYLVKSSFFASSITIPGYTGFPHSKQCGHNNDGTDVGDITSTVKPKDDLSSYSWLEIQNIAQSNVNLEEYGIQIGDTIVYEGKTYYLVDDSRNKEYEGLVFMFNSDVYTSMTYDKNSGGYANSKLKKTVDNMYNTLEIDLQSVIKTVTIKSNDGNNNYQEIHESNVKLFLGSVRELGFTDEYLSNKVPSEYLQYLDIEGTAFDWFTGSNAELNRQTLIDQAETAFTGNGFWSRSANSNSNYSFWWCNSLSADAVNADYYSLVIPVFVIG